MALVGSGSGSSGSGGSGSVCGTLCGGGVVLWVVCGARDIDRRATQREFPDDVVLS